jgi:hypothetical protein
MKKKRNMPDMVITHRRAPTSADAAAFKTELAAKIEQYEKAKVTK